MAGVVQSTPCKLNSFFTTFTDEDFIRQLEDTTIIDSVAIENGVNLSDKSIIELVKKNKQLKKVDLKSCSQISDKSIIFLAENCTDLESLDLSWCNISSRSIDALGINCKNLKRINVRSCYITDCAIENLVQNCSNLEELLLPWCKSITKKTLDAVIENVPSITAFDIRGNERIKSKEFVSFFKDLKDLTTLHLKRCWGVDDTVIESLMHHSLRKLNLRGCSGNFSQNVWLEFLEKQTHLESLDVAWHSYLTDEIIESLTKNSKNLKAIDISGCINLTDRALNALKGLNKIILFNNPKMTDSLKKDLRDIIQQF